MNIKKYYATDMQEALRQIKEELGPDAVIISSKMIRAKKGPLGLFSRRIIEVVASYEKEDRPVLRTRPAPPRSSAGVSAYSKAAAAESYAAVKTEGNAALNSQIGELKKMIESVSTKMDGMGRGSVSSLNDEAAALYRHLVGQDVDAEFAEELCEKAQDIAVRKGVTPAEVLESLILEELGAPSHILPAKFQRKVVMIIGPTGVGKTTTLVKLASDMIVRQGLKVGVVNSDVYRVGAQEQLKTYCEILGIKMHTIYKPEELADTLAELQDTDVVFLDTAGKVPGDAEYQREIAGLVKAGEVDQIYLTLSASTSVRTMKEILKNYSFLETHSLMITKLDEAGTKGALLNACHYSKRPLSYITVGQAVPDDICMVKPGDIVKELVGY